MVAQIARGLQPRAGVAIIMNKHILIYGFLIHALFCWGYLRGEDKEEFNQRFFEECLKNESVFIHNPPAEKNPYAGMDAQEKEKRLQRILKDGSILYLWPSGSLRHFWTRKDFKNDGMQMRWYENGQMQVRENFDQEKLIEGKYWDEKGQLLGEVTQGNGERFLFEDFGGNTPSSKIPYLNGIKEGVEIRFQENSSGKIHTQTVYKAGKIVERVSYYPSGQTNVVEYNDDQGTVKKSEYFHQNGLLQTLIEKDNVTGESVIRSYFDNGQKKAFDSPHQSVRWNELGLILYQLKRKNGVVEATSFDSQGHTNGAVRANRGYLMTPPERQSDDAWSMDIYEGNTTPVDSIKMPKLRVTAGFSPEGQVFDFHSLILKAPDNAGIQSGKIEIILPEGCRAESDNILNVPALISGEEKSLGKFKFKVPISGQEWQGIVSARIHLKIKDCDAVYEQIIYQKKGSYPKSTVARPKKPDQPPQKVNINHMKWEKPEIEGKEWDFSSLLIGAFVFREECWLVYREPAALLHSIDRGKTWSVKRMMTGFKPYGMFLDEKGTLYVWGDKIEKQNQKGMPFYVECSSFPYSHWEEFRTPPLDYLINLSVENGIIHVRGIQIPTDGIPEGKTWFELPRANFISEDKINFTVIEGNSFLMIGDIFLEKSITSGGIIFIQNNSFLDPSYTLYFARDEGEMPRNILTVSQKGKVIWSKNYKIVCMENNGKIFAYVNLETGVKEVIDFDDRHLNDQEKIELDTFDDKARKILAENID